MVWGCRRGKIFVVGVLKYKKWGKISEDGVKDVKTLTPYSFLFNFGIYPTL